MPITFAFRSQVQIVQFVDTLTAEEEPAVRLKIDEKISQNRKHFLFQLEKFDLNHEQSRKRVLNLLLFCKEHKVALAICLQKQYWAVLTFQSKPVAECFGTEAEAIAFLFPPQAPAADPKAAKPTAAKIETKDDSQSKATDDLLKKYEAFQADDEFDPYSLKKMAELYAVNPNMNSLEQLEKAVAEIQLRRERISQLQTQCEQLAIQTTDLNAIRKLPIKDIEVGARLTTLKSEKEKLGGDLKLYHEKIRTTNVEVQKYERWIQELKTAVLEKKI